jgi:imidazolonepropionase-like amidohydrolase
MQMTREDLQALHQGTLPKQAVGKFRRDHEQIQAAQRRVAASSVKIAYGTDCGMFPFSHGINEFQAMTAAGISPVRALKAAASVAAELLDRDDLGVFAPGRCADLVAMPGGPHHRPHRDHPSGFRDGPRPHPPPPPPVSGPPGRAAPRGRRHPL